MTGLLAPLHPGELAHRNDTEKVGNLSGYLHILDRVGEKERGVVGWLQEQGKGWRETRDSKIRCFCLRMLGMRACVTSPCAAVLAFWE